MPIWLPPANSGKDAPEIASRGERRGGPTKGRRGSLLMCWRPGYDPFRSAATTFPPGAEDRGSGGETRGVSGETRNHAHVPPPVSGPNNDREPRSRPCVPECHDPPSRKSRRTATAPRYQTKGADDVLWGETMNAAGTKRNLASWVACAQAYGTDAQRVAILSALHAAWQRLLTLASSSGPTSDCVERLAGMASVVLELANLAGAPSAFVEYLQSLTAMYEHATQSENDVKCHETEAARLEQQVEHGTEVEQREAARSIAEFADRCDELARRRGGEARAVERRLNASQVRAKRPRVQQVAPRRERARGRSRRPSQRVSRFRPSRRVQVDAGGATLDDGPSTGDADPPGPLVGFERRGRSGAVPSARHAHAPEAARRDRCPKGTGGAT